MSCLLVLASISRLGSITSSARVSHFRRPRIVRLARTITGRGIRSTDDVYDLFHYTSGRWVYNDTIRHEERRNIFDSSELKRLAAASVSRKVTDIVCFRKLAEGGFNRTFELLMKDGFKMVARIPYPSTGPRELSTASEVATMTLLRAHGLPVPEIYAYSATAQNTAGTEYVFMEYAKGINLGDVWSDLEQKDKLKVMENIILLETRLFDVKFPSYGSVYFEKDLQSQHCKLPLGLQESVQHHPALCIGPDTALALWYGRRAQITVSRGPFTAVEDVINAGAQKEIAYLEAFGQPLLPYHRIRRETFKYEKQLPAVHIDSLQKYKRLAPALIPRDDTSTIEPTIRHPDLQPNNIFISDNLEITAIIDWQHCSVLPMFLHCGVPTIFSNSSDPASRTLQTPRLPSNISELDEEGRYEVTQTFHKRQLHYEYLCRTQAVGGKHLKAISYPFAVAKRRFYELSCSPWEADNVSLRSSLVSMVQNWQNFTNSESPCPVSFTTAESEEYLRLDEEQREADAILHFPRSIFEIGPEGWVPIERYEQVKAGLEAYKAEAVAGAETDMDRQMILTHWPYDDMDEEPYL